MVCPEGPWGIDFFEKSSENRNPKNPRNKKSQDWPDLDPEPIFLDFGNIVMVRKAPRKRLNASRGPETLKKYVFRYFGDILYNIQYYIQYYKELPCNSNGMARVIPMGPKKVPKECHTN